jgi:hypothetical protein
MAAAPRSDRGLIIGCVIAGVGAIGLLALLGVLGWMFYRESATTAAAARTATAVAQPPRVPTRTTGPTRVAGRVTVTATPIALVFPTIPTQAPADDPASVPRMPLAAFKKLYDDPATRPLILDVRSKDTYDDGHIAGAISFPEADMDTRVGELPKDKLIIAYCQ